MSNLDIAGASLKGGAVGAATGAAVGSFIPVIGTGIGALVGGTIGLVAGGYSEEVAEDPDVQKAKRYEDLSLSKRIGLNISSFGEKAKKAVYGIFGDDYAKDVDDSSTRLLEKIQHKNEDDAAAVTANSQPSVSSVLSSSGAATPVSGSSQGGQASQTSLGSVVATEPEPSIDNPSYNERGFDF